MMPRSARRALAATAVLAGAATAAHAQPLGDEARQYLVTSDARLDYQRTSVDVPGDAPDPTRTDYAFRLAGDYTIAPHVTVGGLIGFEGVITDDDSTKAFLIGARAGYLLGLGDHVSWWPRVGLAYVNTSGLDSLERSITSRTIRLNVSAPFVFQPYAQVLVGVGPTFDQDLRSKTGPEDDGPKARTIGVQLLFGLWFY